MMSFLAACQLILQALILPSTLQKSCRGKDKLDNQVAVPGMPTIIPVLAPHEVLTGRLRIDFASITIALKV